MPTLYVEYTSALQYVIGPQEGKNLQDLEGAILTNEQLAFIVKTYGDMATAQAILDNAEREPGTSGWGIP